MELAARLADVGSRAIGLRYGVGPPAVAAVHRRLAERPDVLRVVESLVKGLHKMQRS